MDKGKIQSKGINKPQKKKAYTTRLGKEKKKKNLMTV